MVTPLTGVNHYIAELFFVRTNDIPHTAQAHKLGSFTDVGSRHVVSLGYRANIVLRVTDAARLVTTLAGQRTSATESLGMLVDARLQGILASVVGRLASAEPILQVASNQFSDDLGAHVIARANEVFARHGLSVVQCLGRGRRAGDGARWGMAHRQWLLRGETGRSGRRTRAARPRRA